MKLNLGIDKGVLREVIRELMPPEGLNPLEEVALVPIPNEGTIGPRFNPNGAPLPPGRLGESGGGGA
jgi:hypothetical protein